MNQQANVVVRNQYVYLMDNATVNVFDCTDSNTGQRDVYYIQKGRIMDTVQFQETRRVNRNRPQPMPQPMPQPPPGRQPQHIPPPREASSSDSEDDMCQSSSTAASTTNAPAAAEPAQDSTDMYIDILASTRTVTDDELQNIATHLQYDRDTNTYHRLAIRLGLDSSEVDRIHKERRAGAASYDTKGTIFLILKAWKAQSSEPTVGMMGRTMESCGLQKHITDTLSP